LATPWLPVKWCDFFDKQPLVEMTSISAPVMVDGIAQKANGGRAAWITWRMIKAAPRDDVSF
jgi:hypothetical protein